MKTIGFVMGSSPQASKDYYELINQYTNERLGRQHSARMVMANLDFQDVVDNLEADDWDSMRRMLVDAATTLEGAGAELLGLCSNTLHRCADDISQAVSIRLVHIADAVASAVLNDGLQTVGLLGTASTMRLDFHRARMAGHGIQVIVPGEVDIQQVDRVIFEELCRGQVLEESKACLLDVIGRLQKRGAQGVILGCTEIQMLIQAEDYDIPLYDTMRLHARAIVECALED